MNVDNAFVRRCENSGGRVSVCHRSIVRDNTSPIGCQRHFPVETKVCEVPKCRVQTLRIYTSGMLRLRYELLRELRWRWKFSRRSSHRLRSCFRRTSTCKKQGCEKERRGENKCEQISRACSEVRIGNGFKVSKSSEMRWKLRPRDSSKTKLRTKRWWEREKRSINKRDKLSSTTCRSEKKNSKVYETAFRWTSTRSLWPVDWITSSTWEMKFRNFTI